MGRPHCSTCRPGAALGSSRARLCHDADRIVHSRAPEGALDEFRPHGDQPVRAISFLGSGHLVSGAKCGGVVVSGVEDCKEVRAYAKALPAAVTRVHCLDESTVAVGGEVGHAGAARVQGLQGAGRCGS